MTDSNAHCPGFESNKTLKEVKIKCPSCDVEWEVFEDEMEKSGACPSCGVSVELKSCVVQ